MESIRLFLRKCVDSANVANGIIDMNVVYDQYAEFGDNLFNLNLEDALFVSVVRIMNCCDDLHVSDVYAMWNACREFMLNGYEFVTMDQLHDSYMKNPREFAKCIRDEQNYIDVVENNDDFKLNACLFEIVKLAYRLSLYTHTHSNVMPEAVVWKYTELPKYGLYDE